MKLKMPNGFQADANFVDNDGNVIQIFKSMRFIERKDNTSGVLMLELDFISHHKKLAQQMTKVYDVAFPGSDHSMPTP
jgi:hypothetical protein